MNGTNSQARVAIVTGGSRGIGRAAVRRLAADGFAIVAVYASSQQEADAAVAEAEKAGVEAIAVAADVADERAMADLFDLTEERFGGVDVVVHAAGRLALSTVADFDLDELDELHRTNIRGAFVVSQQAARRLRSGGTLVNFSTSIVALAYPTYAGYSATKGAVEAMTPILARELRGRDVTTNAVAPGPTATDFFLDGKDQDVIDQAAAGSPLGRLGTPEDVVELVAFLASPQGHWVNGQVVRVNGGVI